MTDPVAVFGKPFKYQLAALRLRFRDLRSTDSWDEISEHAHNRAFMVAGAKKADLLADFALAIDKAVAQGTGLEAFAKDFRSIVTKHGWHGWTGEGTKGGEAWRIKTIHRTNMRTSYMSGRFAQLRDGNFKYWIYRHGGSLEPRLQHLGWDGLILEPDHPFWASHFPPNGWGCTCRVFGANSLAGAVRRGGKEALKLPDDWQAPDPRTGLPTGIGKGWGYAPGSSVAKTVSLAADKITQLPPILGSDFGASLEKVIDRYWPTWVADTLVGGGHEAALAGVMSKDVIAALSTRGVAPSSAEIMVKPGLLNGPKAARHGNVANALQDEDWVNLPAALRDPQAVYMDVDSGALLYFLKSANGLPQLAVRLDQADRRTRIEKRLVNLVVSAFRVNMTDVMGRIKGGKLVPLLGNLG